MKRILYTIVGIMLCMSVGAQTTLQQQINEAANGATIALDADVNLTSQVEIADKSITIDLNGKTISYSGSALSSGIILIHNGAGLTINATGGGSINSGIAMAAIALTKKGDDASTPATLVVNGGTITGSNYGITGNGTRPNTDITINGGTITATVANDNFGIYHPQDGKLTITGGTITAHSAAIEMRAGTLNISGGTFTATATEYSCNPNGNGTTTVGAALAIAQHTTKKDISVAISGGTFTGVKALNESNPQANDPAPQVNMTITDGTLNGEISTADVQNFIAGGTFDQAVPEEYCKNGFILKDNGDGTFGVKEGTYVAQIGENKYESLAEAISAATTGQTITLLANTTENVTIPAGKDITLDLNGMTFSGGSVASNGKKAAILNYGSVIIKDSSAEQTGTIKRDDPENYDQSNSYYVIDNQGTMTIKSGTITNNAGLTTAHKGSSLIRNGEVIEGAVLNIEGGTLTQKNFDVIKNGGNNSVLNITGGTINSANSYAILSYDDVNMSAGTVTGKVCLRSYDSDYAVANITGGTINGNITVETYPGNTPTHLSECNISGDAIINGTLSVGEGDGYTFTANDNNGTIAVSGGTFDQAVPEEYCKNGFIPKDNGNGTFGVKEGTYVAQIGEQGYETLAAAVEAATDEQTITLLDGITISEVLKISKSVTLDLNGNVITANKMIYVNGDGKNVTIKDSKATVAPTVDADHNVNYTSGKITTAGSIFYIYNNATLTLESGTLESTGSYPIYVDDDNAATFTMNGGYVHGAKFAISLWASTTVQINGGVVKSDDQAAITGNGSAQWSTEKGTTVNITGGTIIAKSKTTGDIACGIYNPQSGVVNISGGTIYADNGAGVVMRAGDLNITGGSIITTGSGEGYVGDAKINVPMSAVVVDVDAKYPCNTLNDLDVAITGGTLTSADGVDAITILNEKETKPTTDIVSVSGATLSGPIYTTETFSMTAAEVPFAFDNYRVKKAEYTREGVSTTTWGTVCLPFSITAAENGYKYYTPTSVTSNELTITEITEFPIAAGTPVIFQKVAGEVVITSSEAIVSKTATAGSGTGTLALVGTFEEQKITDGLTNIYYINGDKFHQAKASLTVPAYRAYINYSAPAPSGQKPAVLSLFIGEDETTDIKTIATDVKTATSIHDVNGRLLSAPQKGLNIVKLANGKTVKLIVK